MKIGGACLRSNALSMKGRSILGVLLMLLLAGGLVYLAQEVKTETDSSTSIKLPDELTPYARQFEEIASIRQQNPKLANEKTEALMESMPDGPLQRWVALALTSGIEEIKFYGRVVDQNGRPLSGAKVHYDAPGKFYASGSGMEGVI